MNAQIEAAAAAVAAACRLDAARVEAACAEARRAGYTTRLDRLAAVLIAARAPRGRRGPKARDPLLAAVWRHSPRQQRDELARIRARLKRAGGAA